MISRNSLKNPDLWLRTGTVFVRLLSMVNQDNLKMEKKFFVLTRVNLDKVGFHPENVWLFNTREDAYREMRSQYDKALNRTYLGSGEAIDDWYAYIPMRMYWDIYEKSLQQAGNMPVEDTDSKDRPLRFGERVTTYVGTKAEGSGLMMYRSIEDYLHGEICYIPAGQFNRYSVDRETPMLSEATVRKCRLGETKGSIEAKVRCMMGILYPDMALLLGDGNMEWLVYEVFRRLDGKSVEEFMEATPRELMEVIVAAAKENTGK